VSEIQQTFLELIEFYREHPIVALKDLLNIDLAIPQRILFRSMWFNKFVIITAGRGTGKTFLCGAYASLRAILYPGTRIGLLAPSFRQSKLIFEEVKGIWNKADILREATTGRPTMQSDRCILNFRTVGNTPQSLIEADPLGTGEKIRGLRMHILLIDEFAQMPPDIFDAVVKPMAATTSSPMENVRRIEKINKLRDAGIDTTELENTGVANKIITVSSAFYKFNHMYKRIEEYERFMDNDKEGYDVQYVNYREMPEGFMNKDIIEEAQATMPASLFRMEYEAIWESDSDGIFKASLLEKCMIPAGRGDTVSLVGKPGKSYVLGCDPAATTDEFAIVVIELGEINKVVNAYVFQKKTMPKMADIIIGICERYNVVRIMMDSQGGGHAVKDSLADTKYKQKAIIDPDDEEYVGAEGRRILSLVNPSPRFNTEANYATLSLLEQGKMFFVGRPLNGNKEEEEAYDIIAKLINQMMNIVVTETRAGVTHFDVPKGGGHGVQKKDLYSAMIYACSNIYEVGRNINPESNILWGSGIVMPVSKEYSDNRVPIITSPAAILHKKNK
jgi:phage terminase large subunit-like protein